MIKPSVFARSSAHLVTAPRPAPWTPEPPAAGRWARFAEVALPRPLTPELTRLLQELAAAPGGGPVELRRAHVAAHAAVQFAARACSMAELGALANSLAKLAPITGAEHAAEASDQINGWLIGLAASCPASHIEAVLEYAARAAAHAAACETEATVDAAGRAALKAGTAIPLYTDPAQAKAALAKYTRVWRWSAKTMLGA